MNNFIKLFIKLITIELYILFVMYIVIHSQGQERSWKVIY